MSKFTRNDLLMDKTEDSTMQITNEEVRSGINPEKLGDRLLEEVINLDEDNNSPLFETFSLYEFTNIKSSVQKIIKTEINIFIIHICNQAIYDVKNSQKKDDLSINILIDFLLYQIYIKLLDINIYEIQRLRKRLLENDIDSEVA